MGKVIKRDYSGEHFERATHYKKSPSDLSKDEITHYLETCAVPLFFASPLPRRQGYVEIGKGLDGGYQGPELPEEEMRAKAFFIGPEEISHNTYYNEVLEQAVERGIITLDHEPTKHYDSLHAEINEFHWDAISREIDRAEEAYEEIRRVDWNEINKIWFMAST